LTPFLNKKMFIEEARWSNLNKDFSKTVIGQSLSRCVSKLFWLIS